MEYLFFKNDLFVYIRFWDVEDNALMDREERLRTKTVQRLTPPSFVHMIMICWFQLRLTDQWQTDCDKVLVFLYITESDAHFTLLYYDACVILCHARIFSVSLMPIAAALVAVNPSLLQL